MEKASKILIWMFIALVIYLIWAAFNPPKPELDPFADIYAVDGESMLPTLKPGDRIHYSKRAPIVGEIIILKCLSSRCHPSEEDKKNGGPTYVKRVEKIENGCYTVLGDNTERSFDSRNFGPLCNSEIEILGVADSVDYK